MVGTFWLTNSPASAYFFSINQTMCSHDTTFFTFYFIATLSRGCLKCKAIPISPDIEAILFWRTCLDISLIFSLSGPWPSSVWPSWTTDLAYEGHHRYFLWLELYHWFALNLCNALVSDYDPYWPEPDETGLLSQRVWVSIIFPDGQIPSECFHIVMTFVFLHIITVGTKTANI